MASACKRNVAKAGWFLGCGLIGLLTELTGHYWPVVLLGPWLVFAGYLAEKFPDCGGE